MIDKCEPPPELRGVDGWHWVQLPFVAVPTSIAWMGNPANFEREWRMPSSSAFVSGESKTARTWRYLCPVLTPAEADALRKKYEDDMHGAIVKVAKWAQLAGNRQAEIDTLRARVAVLEEALKQIANHPEAEIVLTDYGPDGRQRVWPTVAQEARAALSTGSET